MYKYRRTIFIITTAFIMAASSILVSADTISDLKNKQNQIKTDQQKAKDFLNDTLTEKSLVQKEILQLDVQLEEAEEELQFITDELGKTNARLSQAKIELEQATKSRETQYETLKKRIRYMYENGSVGYLDVIFDAADFSDFVNRYEYINKIIEFDDNLIDNLMQTEQTIADTVTEIDTKKLEQEILASQQQDKKNELEVALEQKNAVVAKLLQNQQTYEQQLSDLEAASNNVKALIKEAEAKAEAARKAAAAQAQAAKRAQAPQVKYNGVFAWPVSGYTRINDEYGYRKNPISGKGELHTGLDIQASTGTNIFAAADGVVITARYMNGYGNTVIIDHGGGISTLYGHNSKLVVSAGQEVKKGQVISKAGSTGYSTGPHLHFEVRQNGVAISPWTYLK